MIPTCLQCDSQLPRDASCDLCPNCLRNLGLYSQPLAPREPTTSALGSLVTPDQMADWFPLYEFIELLGHGHTSTVYKVRHLKLNCVQAMKMLSPKLRCDREATTAFMCMARVMAWMHHPNIVTAHDVGETRDVYYLNMECVDALNLREFMKQQMPPPEQSQLIAKQICDALRFVRSEGIELPDLKPENVLVDREYRVLLGSSTWRRCRVTPQAKCYSPNDP